MRVKPVTSFSAETMGEVGTNCWGPAVRKRVQGPTVFHVYFFLGSNIICRFKI